MSIRGNNRYSTYRYKNQGQHFGVVLVKWVKFVLLVPYNKKTRFCYMIRPNKKIPVFREPISVFREPDAA